MPVIWPDLMAEGSIQAAIGKGYNEQDCWRSEGEHAVQHGGGEQCGAAGM